MVLKQYAPWFIGGAFILSVILSVAFMAQGVVRDDHDRNIAILDDLLMTLQVKAAYNEDDIFWRFEWDAPEASWYHDSLVYRDGEWAREGRSPVGPEEFGLYEDRLTFFVDDGSVEFFAQYGGFITIVSDMRFMTRDVSTDEAQQHIGRDDVRKFLPDTRTDPHDWRTLRPEEELEALHETGYFLDLWHWRAHRANPIGFADDQYVSWYRLSDEGDSPWLINWDEEAGQPTHMFDPELTGQHAMRWERIIERGYTQDDHYYLSTETAVPFDPDHQWQEGDVLPRRVLREPTGSRGDIWATGVWDEGKWKVDLVRALDTGNPRDDKILMPLGKYDVAFAVHAQSTGSRWHYVSMPFTLGLDREADIRATRFNGDAPDWDEIEWTEIKLFYPGQISWDHIYSEAHAGYEDMQRQAAWDTVHDEEKLAIYAVESEFRGEIRRQWMGTTVVWAVIFLSASWAVIRIGRRQLADKGA